MITAITGKNGSGKTYVMVREAFARWKNGEDIYSNTPLLFDRWRKPGKKRGRVIYYEDINDIIHIRSGVVLFDEAQALLNSRNWENLPDEFQFKLQQHRKHQLDMICTTPNMGSIDIVYRRLVHRWLHCENVFTLGRSPRVLIQLTRVNEKDVDQLYNVVDDLVAETIESYRVWIHYFSRALYNTMFDIGFRRFAIHLIEIWDPKKPKKIFLISPKKQNPKSVLADISSYRLHLSRLTSTNFTKS